MPWLRCAHKESAARQVTNPRGAPVQSFDFMNDRFADYAEDGADALVVTDLVSHTTNPNLRRSLDVGWKVANGLKRRLPTASCTTSQLLSLGS